jgi:hypothetical protein
MFFRGSACDGIAPEHHRRNVEDRNIHQYKFHHYCRTILTLLGIISEIEIHCNLNNKEQAVKVCGNASLRIMRTQKTYIRRVTKPLSAGSSGVTHKSSPTIYQC